MDYDEILFEVEEKMEKTLSHLSDEFRGIRSGRATPGLVEFIKVNYYGALTPLKQMATISVQQPRMILIKPYDRSSLGEIEKAILKSELGIAPNNDGKVIRLQVPVLSEERRRQLVARIKEIAEGARVSVRNVRREGNRKAEQMEKESSISEDEADKLKEEIQQEIKEAEQKIEELVSKKTEEIMEN